MGIRSPDGFEECPVEAQPDFASRFAGVRGGNTGFHRSLVGATLVNLEWGRGRPTDHYMGATNGDETLITAHGSESR